MAVQRRTGVFNPKRRIADEEHLAGLDTMALSRKIRYCGNPEHKLHPADYGLGPPPSPRPGKTLCDGNGPFLRKQAEELLRLGCRKGMLSEQCRGSWPQNIWAVDKSGNAYEAQLENQEKGEYHGYPMPMADPLRDLVISTWEKRQKKP